MSLSSQIKKTRRGQKVRERHRFYAQLNKQIYELMDEQGLTTKELARKSGMDQALMVLVLVLPERMTMEAASKIFGALGRRIEIIDHDINDDGDTNS